MSRAKVNIIKTTWDIRTYDVWGNAKDGYDVNDSFRRGSVTLDLIVITNNPGQSGEFQSAHVVDKQIREVFGLGNRTGLDVQGDDLTYYINRERDGYPIGELYCTSHESLSPIREKAALSV